MALLLIEGFELQDVGIFADSSGTPVIATATPSPRTGSGAAYLELAGSSTFAQTREFAWDAANDRIICGFAYYYDDVDFGGVSSDQTLFGIGGFPDGQVSDDSWITINVQSGDPSKLRCGIVADHTSVGGDIESATGTLKVQTWHYIEIEWLCHESTGFLEFWVDGVSQGSIASGDTMGETTAAFKPESVRAVFQTISSFDENYFDDFYMLTNNTTSPETGTSPNIARLGDIVIEALSPTSDAVPNDFTRSAGANNWELVDEIPHTTDTDYVESNTAAHEDRYGLSNRTHTGAVVGVNVQYVAKKTDANARTLDIGLTSNAGATVDAQPVSMALANGTYGVGQKIYDRDFHDEVTAADWTTAKVNALETSTVVV